MPAFAFDNNGSFTNATNLTVGANGTNNYVIHNSTGSATVITIDIGNNITDATITKVTGERINLMGSNAENRVDIDGDESFYLTITNGAGAAAAWRVAAGQTYHGLSAKRGRGHTTVPALNTVVAATNIVVATI